MTTQEINNKLQIVNVKGKRFSCPYGYYEIDKGFAFCVPELGYLAFNTDYSNTHGYMPYTPLGGRKALKEIVSSGGLINFNNVIWVKEFN